MVHCLVRQSDVCSLVAINCNPQTLHCWPSNRVANIKQTSMGQRWKTGFPTKRYICIYPFPSVCMCMPEVCATFECILYSTGFLRGNKPQTDLTSKFSALLSYIIKNAIHKKSLLINFVIKFAFPSPPRQYYGYS